VLRTSNHPWFIRRMGSIYCEFSGMRLGRNDIFWSIKIWWGFVEPSFECNGINALYFRFGHHVGLWANNDIYIFFVKRRYQTPGNYYLINTHHKILKKYSNSKLLQQLNSHEKEHLFSYLSESLLAILQDLLECSFRRKSW